MRVCPNCGKEQPDDTVFCGECGTKLEETEPVEKAASSEEASIEDAETDEAKSESEEESAGTSTDTSGAVEQVSAESDSASETVEESDASEVSQSTKSEGGETKRKGLSRNRLIGIIIAIVVVIVVVIIVLVVALGNSGISKETVEDDFKKTSYYAGGIVPSNYVNESTYDLVDFSIDGQKQETTVIYDTEYTGCDVYFSGTMENANFRTEFSGNAYYIKYNDSWLLGSKENGLSGNGFQIDDNSKSEPLKGVDFGTDLSSSIDNCTFGEYTSTFNNEDYTSELSRDRSYGFWFATDTATYRQTFTFDNEKGWTPVSDPQVDDTTKTTEWKLAGKTFDLSEKMSPMWSNGTVDSSLTFTECNNNKVVADYTVNYVPASDDNDKNYGTFYEINLSGSATSAHPITHTFGDSRFSFELNDSEQEVTFSCSQGSGTEVAGSGTVNSLSVGLKTVSNYRVYTFVGTTNEYPLEFSRATYAENTTSSS